MDKKYCIILVLLFLAPLINAQSWPFTSETITTNLNIHSDFDIIRSSAASKVNYVKVNLSFLPKDDFQQKVLSLTTDPESEKGDNYVLYTWDNPAENNLKFSLTSGIKTANTEVKVKEKIKFPINIPDELSSYTKPSQTIDSDDAGIFILANRLAKGEDDLYKVVFNLADWVKTNIEYDLSTLTADVTQKSSWVLNKRYGVCDEITNLFIALNRALGIPAKFVSGVSYTNSEQFTEKWGPHGWAEIYFPGYGWIPFDVTYGEFGYIDPTHIKLKESIDADESSTRYQWLGSRVDIKTKSLDFDIELIEHKGGIPSKISVDLEPLKSSVEFGSYNLIEAKVKNMEDYYVASEIYLVRSLELDILDEERRQILLGPNEEMKVYWIIKVSDALKKRFVYTFPLEISFLNESLASASFTSSQNDHFYSLAEIESLLSLRQEKEEKTYSKDIDLRCTPYKSSFYEYENIKVSCTIRNSGNVLLENGDFCIDENCQKITLGIGEEKKAEFDFTPIKTGEQELLIEVKSTQILKSEFLKINVLDKPIIEIAELQHQDNVSFEDNYNISFILKKESASNPKNVIIDVYEEGFKKTWSLNELINDKKFVVNLRGKDLSMGENNLFIRVKFYDDNNNEYYIEEGFIIKLNKVSFSQRFQIFFTDIAKFFGRLF